MSVPFATYNPRDYPDLPKSQRGLAEAAANSAANSDNNSGDNLIGFFNKGLSNFLGSGVDAITAGLNEMTTLRNKSNNFLSNLTGISAPDPKPLLDPSQMFGGTASIQRGLDKIGAPVPQREPQTFLEGLSQGTGELGSYLVPSAAMTVIPKAAVSVTRGASWIPSSESSETASNGTSSSVAMDAGSPVSPVSPVDTASQDRPASSRGPSARPTPASPVTPASPASPASPVTPVGIGMGYGKEFSTNTSSRGITPTSTFGGDLDLAAQYADSISGAMGTPMTGMRPIDPNTGEPMSQRVIDIANRIGLQLQEASVPVAPQAPMSPRELAVAEQEARLDRIRSGEGLSDAALIATGKMEAPEGYYDRPTEAPVPKKPEMTAGEQAQANFETFKASGKKMEPEQVVQAQDLAASAGRTFDEDTGYSKDFDPVIQEAYLERQRQMEGRKEVQPTEAQGEAGETKPQSDYEKQVQEDEQKIVDRARSQGRSEEYIDEMLGAVRERRKEAEDQQSYEDLKRQLEIKKLNKELSAEEAEVDIGKVNATYKMMKDQGVAVDPNTGAISISEKGFFGTSEKPLASNSALFQQLSLTPEGRYILNTKPPEINSVENPSEEMVYPAKDGRMFMWNGSKWNVVTQL